MKKVLLVSLFILSCAPPRYLSYNFTKDAVMVASVGSDMMNWTTYAKNVDDRVMWTFEQVLTYSGKQGTSIKIFYREASNNFARPAFTQELTYDIASDSTLTFRGTTLKIVEATNNRIKFVVLDTPVFKSNFKSGDRLVD